jgi:hypothetical protein
MKYKPHIYKKTKINYTLHKTNLQKLTQIAPTHIHNSHPRHNNNSIQQKYIHTQKKHNNI